VSLIFYISPSVLPTRSANSIHAVNMCEGIAQLKHRVVLFSAANISKAFDYKKVLIDFYGVSCRNITVISYQSKGGRGIEISIALKSLWEFITFSVKGDKPSAIISRNLYAAIIFGLFLRQKVVYETHSPEHGYRKKFQKWLLNSSKIQTVVISQALKNVMCRFHSVCGIRIHVFHDAARFGKLQLNNFDRKNLREDLFKHTLDFDKYVNFVGYFGHLYSGRGIEIIQGIAKKNLDCVFIVYGGNEKDIECYKKYNTISNLFFMGHIPPNLVHNAMSMMDVLLMPYQKNVSIGLEGVDTAKWMSPMKMFEYLSVGVPIISSNLPVLREILVNRNNSILVEADNVDDWSVALRSIIRDPVLAKNLGNNAFYQYKSKHTWNNRAKNIINLLGISVD
jgi:glycosyltransferase involved in cell wall biosynthesis